MNELPLTGPDIAGTVEIAASGPHVTMLLHSSATDPEELWQEIARAEMTPAQARVLADRLHACADRADAAVPGQRVLAGLLWQGGEARA